MGDHVFPCGEWARQSAQEAGFAPEKLRAAEAWLRETAGDEPFRAVIARRGFLVAEWGQGIDPDQALPQASASKSFFSSMLGIAVAEGKIAGLDARVAEYYPEMMEVGEGEGPKPGRYAFPKDREITFRQLIGNTSGYMKPGEAPGTVFHYQTFGMNLLTHAIATAYGHYDSHDPGRLPGCGKLIEEKLRNPIGAAWRHSYSNFALPPQARLGIFGNFVSIIATARDTARAGHLWLNRGRWGDRQVLPEGYLRQATVTNPDILRHEPKENWKYGLGFWVNDRGKQWPDLPRDSFAASGAGAKHIWVCPSLDLVVAQNPGPWNRLQSEADKVERQSAILTRVLDAIQT